MSRDFLEDNSSTGDMAEWLGITPQGLRWYEEQGLVSPQRKGAFRTYTREDRFVLSCVRDYLKMGFSLDDIAGMQRFDEVVSLEDRFSDRLSSLRRDIAFRKKLLDVVDEREQALHQLVLREGEFEEHVLEPSAFLIDQTISLTGGKSKRGISFRHWAENTPFVRYFIVSEFDGSEERERVIGAWLHLRYLECVSDEVRNDIEQGRAFKLGETTVMRGMCGLERPGEGLPRAWSRGVMLRSPLACKKVGDELIPYWEVIVLPAELKSIFGLV
jgi:DNA-binding transcriptional MerR regulator